MKSSPYLLNETIHKHGQKYNFDIEFINIVLNLFSVMILSEEKIVLKIFFFFIISKVETTIYLTSKKQKTNDVNS